ncbi:MAG: PIN domain-containing protein [Bacteroidales bacterium]|nr:PIN domain-containing protein [Bacteroidales bacterium]
MLTHGIYLLDTCVCIELLHKNPKVVERLREIGVSNCKISDITVAELFFGAFKSGKQSHFDDVTEILRLFESYRIMHLRKYGELRFTLERKGLKIGDMDMFIAATALEENLILVTGNVEHFSRIPGLKIENWMA